LVITVNVSRANANDEPSNDVLAIHESSNDASKSKNALIESTSSVTIPSSAAHATIAAIATGK
jgi:hypothetical protein